MQFGREYECFSAERRVGYAKVVIREKKIEGYLDDKKYIDYTYKGPTNGKSGLWSKADSYVFFDDFTVQLI